MRWLTRLLPAGGVLAGTLVVMGACGGGGDGGGGTTPPPPPPNNTPARVTLSQAGPITIASGTTATVTAAVFTSDGRELTGQGITWSSTNASIARVDAGTITGALVGNASVTAAVGAVASTPLSVTVNPGAATQLVVRTQPAGARVAQPFQTQPIVEVRDAAGNLVTGSTLGVTAAIGSGGGTLAGLATATATAGVATFSGLSMTGTAGPRTLGFSATGLTSAASSAFTLEPGNPTQAAIVQQPVGGAIAAPLITPAIIELRDVSGNVATGATAPVTATLVGGSGTIAAGASAIPVSGRATFSSLAITGLTGVYQLAFSSAGIPAVTANPIALVPIVYGAAGEKIIVVNQGELRTPVISAGQLPQFRTSAPSRVAVNSFGRMQGLAEGQSWVSASIPAAGDSILVIVPRTANGPIVGAALPSFVLQGGATDIDIFIDPRGTPVGSFSVFVGLNTQDFTAQFNPFTRTFPGGQVAAVMLEGGLMRFSVVTTTPITTPTAFGRVTLLNGPAGARLMLTVSALDMSAPDGSDLFPLATSTFFPLIFR